MYKPDKYGCRNPWYDNYNRCNPKSSKPVFDVLICKCVAPEGGRRRNLAKKEDRDELVEQALEIVNRGLYFANNTVYPVVQLTMVKGSDLTN